MDKVKENKETLKIEILERLAEKLRSCDMVSDAKKIEQYISTVKDITEFYSHKIDRETDQYYISIIADYIRENSRVNEKDLAQRFTI